MSNVPLVGFAYDKEGVEVACRARLGSAKAEADRIAACPDLGILVASCGLEVQAAQLYVSKQLTFWSASFFERWGLFNVHRYRYKSVLKTNKNDLIVPHKCCD